MTNLVCIDNYDVCIDVANDNYNVCSNATNPVENALLQQLQESDRRITENNGRFNKVSMEIGWDGYFIKRHDGWQLLGYEDEKHYRQSKGIGRSTWYKMIGIAERLAHLTREDFLAMTVENAEQLSVQPTEVKQNPELIAKAQTETAEGFADQLVLDTAQRENKPVDDVYVTMKWRIRQGQRKAIESGLEEWQRMHGIDDPGYALELMIAEFRERSTLVGFIAEAIPRLAQAVTTAQTAEELEDLRKLLAAHIQEMGELLKFCCGEAGAEEDAA